MYESNSSSLIGTAGIAAVIVISLVLIGMIVARLYKRATKETSFVRTGFGGELVVMNGGSLVFPVLHDLIPVNMNTLRLEVRRDTDVALITKDRMRVDVIAEFYVRVQPNIEAIANAAQTLGQRTMMPEKLKELVEGKFVDALRAVAAEMTMEELHEKRTDFVQKVQQAVTEDLIKNGLELESVSLTGLDQTSMEFFNPSNAFDAEGLTRLTEEIEQRKKIRNDIERDTEVQIDTKNLETEKMKLEIQRDEEYARLAQVRDVEGRKAAQVAEISREQALGKQAAEEAQILAQKNIDASKIEADREVEQQRIELELTLQQKNIDKEKTVETDTINKEKMIELADQDKRIAIAEKSRAQSEAQAEADEARSLAVSAEEKVVTVRDTSVADRLKRIELIKAEEEAERDAITVRVQAETAKLAAADTAEALREEAQGEADKIRIAAESEAQAEKLIASAKEISYRVDAEGVKAMNEAKNLLSETLIDMEVKLKTIDNLDRIIRESVKPIEKIEGINVIQVEGLGGGSNGSLSADASSGSGNGGGNLVDSAVNGALKYRAQAPIVDGIMESIGLKAGDINGLLKPLQDNGVVKSIDPADRAAD